MKPLRTGLLQPSLLLLSLYVLSACSSNPLPPPVSDQSTQAPIERTPIDINAEEIEPNRPPATREATTLLLAQATAAEEDDEHDNARVYLERAIRLEPRNPELWTALAKSHLHTGNLSAANQHVRKAIALAGTDEGALRFAWLTLADIRAAEGQNVEAQAIRRRYSRSRG